MAGGTGSRVQEFLLEVAKGNVAGHYAVNKFGRNIEVDAAVTADIWDGGHTLASGGTSLIWVAPTQARVHQLVSTSTDDNGDPAGVGARTVEVFYLTDWDTKETSIVKTMNGTTNVALPSLVMINRMKVLTKGVTSSNVGIITATADTDGTVTSRINVGKGQTQQTVFGFPSTQKLYIYGVYAYANKAGGAAGLADVDLLLNPEPSDEILNFIIKHPGLGLQTVGTSGSSVPFHVPKSIFGGNGGGLVKMQALSDSANMDISSGFSGLLIDNEIGAL